MSKKRGRNKKLMLITTIAAIFLIISGIIISYYLTNPKAKLSPEKITGGVGYSPGNSEVGLNYDIQNPYNQIISKSSGNIQSDYDNSLLSPVPKQNGWIIEFKEVPLAVKKLEIENSLPKTLNKASRDTQIKATLDQHKQKILDEHSRALNDINLKVKSVSPANSIKVKGEYTKVFNGISVDASQSEIEKIKSSPYVKKVYPNVEVKAFLMDSVPLINADDVWQLDVDGINPDNSDLVSYYGFEGNANDYKSGNNLVCVSSTCPTLVDGKIGKAYHFDGAKTYLEKTGAYDVNRDYYSIAAWIKVNPGDSRNTILEFAKSDGKRRALMIARDLQQGKPVTHYGDQKGRYANTGDLRDGQWHHLVSTMDSSGPKIYLDGVEVSLTAEESGAPLGTSSKISVGKSLIESVPNYFNGTIDELRIYNRTLTAEEIKELYEYIGGSPVVCGKECLTGKNIKIAVIDTGVDYTHPDLGGCFGPNCKVVGGYDFINNDNDPMDDHGHGTHVASTAAGNGVLKGVAPDARIYAYKVLDSGGGGYENQVISGIEAAIDPDGDGDFSDHLDIISMSLGGWGNPDDPLSKSVDNTVDTGVVVVIAAGNSGPGENSIGSPGTARKAITVGATYKKDYTGTYWGDTDPRVDQITAFSSWGPVRWVDSNGDTNYLMKPDIVSPGAIICAARYDSIFPEGEHPYYKPCLDDKHVQLAGTSMATPIVSGAVALLKQKNPSWTPEEIKMALRNTAKDLSYNVNIQGYGRIDALNAVNVKNPPAIARLNGTKEAFGNINIAGTAKGRSFAKYSLYYRNSANSGWNLIASSNTPVENGILALNFDTSILNEGNNYIKLEVENTNGIKSNDIGILQVNNINIRNPLINDIYRAGDLIQITGSLMGDVKNFYVEYWDGSNWKSEGIILTNNGIGKIQKGIIAIWDTHNVANPGFYNIRVKISYNNGKESNDEINSIYIDPSLRVGWPQRINWSYDPSYPFPDKFNLDNKTINNVRMNISSLIGKNLDANILSTGGYGWAGFLEPMVADINNDGKKEIIVASRESPLKLRVFDDNGKILWEKTFGSEKPLTYLFEGLPIPLVGDLDGDGKLEIIVYASIPEGENVDNSSNSEIYAFKSNGDLLWKKSLKRRDYHPTLLMADLNHDGYNEIVIKGFFGNELYLNDPAEKMAILSASGGIISEWALEQTDFYPWLTPSPAVGNFDSDPDLEIVSVGPSKDAGVIRGDNGVTGYNNKGVIYVYNKDGTIVNGWPIHVPGIIFSSPVVGDINKDGKQEIIVGLWYASALNTGQLCEFPCEEFGGLYVFDRDGKVLPGWPVEKGKMFWSASAIGDINNDGKLEITATSLNGFTYLFYNNGTIVNGWPKSIESMDIHYSDALADVNGDGKLDVLTTTWNKVYAWDLNGLYIEGFPKTLEISAHAPPTIDDLDGDGKLELVASSDNEMYYDSDISYYIKKHRGSIYVWDLDVPYNSNSKGWPMFMHDPQRTGCYDCDKAILQNKVFLTCENTYYTVWSSRACNIADCNPNNYVSCEKGGSPKRASYREKCSKTYSTQCSENSVCNTGDKVIATKPC